MLRLRPVSTRTCLRFGPSKVLTGLTPGRLRLGRLELLVRLLSSQALVTASKTSAQPGLVVTRHRPLCDCLRGALAVAGEQGALSLLTYCASRLCMCVCSNDTAFAFWFDWIDKVANAAGLRRYLWAEQRRYPLDVGRGRQSTSCS